MFFGSLPAVHLLELADACPFNRGGRWGVVKRKSGGATATCPQLLGGDCPHSPRRLLLRLVCLLFRSTGGHSLEGEHLGNRIRETQRTLELNSHGIMLLYYRLTVPPQ